MASNKTLPFDRNCNCSLHASVGDKRHSPTQSRLKLYSWVTSSRWKWLRLVFGCCTGTTGVWTLNKRLVGTIFIFLVCIVSTQVCTEWHVPSFYSISSEYMPAPYTMRILTDGKKHYNTHSTKTDFKKCPVYALAALNDVKIKVTYRKRTYYVTWSPTPTQNDLPCGLQMASAWYDETLATLERPKRLVRDNMIIAVHKFIRHWTMLAEVVLKLWWAEDINSLDSGQGLLSSKKADNDNYCECQMANQDSAGPLRKGYRLSIAYHLTRRTGIRRCYYSLSMDWSHCIVMLHRVSKTFLCHLCKKGFA